MISRYPAEVLQYLDENESADAVKVILKKSPFPGVSSQELAAQLLGRKAAKQKFPFLLEYRHYRYPVKLSLEQSSSSYTAQYKAELVSGSTIADLTGGMGIDAIHFAKSGKTVSYVEINEELCAVNKYNFAELGLQIEVVFCSAEDFLDQHSATYDWLFIDPSRRVGGNRKTGVRNLLPDVVLLQEKMLKLAPNLLIKLSPMQDITEVISEIEAVKEVHVVSVGDDVKELLLVVQKGYASLPILNVVDLKEQHNKLQASWSQRSELTPTGSVAQFIFQPHPAVVKANLHDHVANNALLTKLHANTQLYSGDNKSADWRGRIFEVIMEVPLQKKAASKLLTEKKMNIISKNHPMTPAQIAKKIGVTEGGEHYLIAVTVHDGTRTAFLCKRIR